MKSAERYKYEANCNVERLEIFKVSLLSSIASSLFVANDKVRYALLMIAAGSGVGIQVSSAINCVKEKMSMAHNNGVETVGVTEKHFFTRRNLYRSPSLS